MQSTMPVRYIRDWLGKGSDKNWSNHWIEISAFSNGENVALNKTATVAAGNITGWTTPNFLVDGIQGDYVEVNAVGDKAIIEVDLGEVFDIEEVRVWHYYADGRTYHGTKTEVSENGIDWITIFDSNVSGEYLETPEGNAIFLGGDIQAPPAQNFEQTAQLNMGMSEAAAKIHTAKGYEYRASNLAITKIRYVRDSINGSDKNSANHWTEIKVFSNEINVASGKKITFNKNAIYNGSPIYVTDDDAETIPNYFQPYNLPDKAYVEIDLGELYDVQEIIVWHYYKYGRTYHEAKTEISVDGINWITIFDSDIDGEYLETPEGHAIDLKNKDLLLLLEETTSQDYTAKGYEFIGTDNQEIIFDFGAIQDYTPQGYHFETFGTQIITLGAVANAHYQGNFTATATQPIFITDTTAQTVVFSEGLQFQENTQENVNITHGAAQTFTPFGGYSYSQNGTNAVNLSIAASLLYELGEIGKNSQRAALYLNLQESTRTTYTRNWLEFEAAATIDIVLTWRGESEHTKTNLFEATANENTGLSITASVQYTNPNNYKATAKLTLTLTIKNWVYFESDIYKPTYKIEVRKPNTLWEPTDEDRPDPYIFGRNPDNKIDRRILHLTDIGELKR